VGQYKVETTTTPPRVTSHIAANTAGASKRHRCACLCAGGPPPRHFHVIGGYRLICGCCVRVDRDVDVEAFREASDVRQLLSRHQGAVGLFAVIALTSAVSVDSNRSSDAARNEFMSSSVSKPDQSNSQGKTGCRKASGSFQAKLHHCRNRGHSEGGGFFAKVVFNSLNYGRGSDAF
jgi:hypothetical protein